MKLYHNNAGAALRGSPNVWVNRWGRGSGVGTHIALLCLAFLHYGRTQTGSKVVGQFVEDGIAVNLDGFLGGIADDVAVMAPVEVIFQFRSHSFVEGVIQVICQLFQKIRASHCWPSPACRFLKYRFNRSRNCKRARNNRDLTAGILRSNACAVSSVESPSTSRNTNTVRKLGGRP